MRKSWKVVVFILTLLAILSLGLLLPDRTAPAMAGPRTYCWCVYEGGGWWCYHCCNATGCYDLYCDYECP